ncbi:hypothetical protein [Pusillimonas sp. NJUB218]|uniref:hypothetical protein n=1 Tax=Pusillimonas sp. NJUB218 TaxID=2023230 RepID=UPI000F4C7370|nr:hypothetical protein [Pusillimonas sp. NJUB218]ROT46485.1 hypothetical protein CHR62_00670 [Pusillimonas sp. NJUB218]
MRSFLLAAMCVAQLGWGAAVAQASLDPVLPELTLGDWSALSKTAVAITGDVSLQGNVLVFDGTTRYRVEPTQEVGLPGGSLEVTGLPFYRLRLIDHKRVPASRLKRPVYLRNGNPLCGDDNTYLYAQFQTHDVRDVNNAVLSIHIFEPPKSGAKRRPHYCAAYNYLREVPDDNTPAT